MSLLEMASFTSPPKLSTPFLGSIAEICIVTPDIYKTMDGLCKLGLGPIQVFHFSPETVKSQYYRGNTAEFELRVCFAKQNSLVVELMQPISGPILMADYLARNSGKEGIQHVAFDCDNIPMGERKKKVQTRGFEVAMEGIWIGKKGPGHFVFFDTENEIGMVFESMEFSSDWENPACEWYLKPQDF